MPLQLVRLFRRKNHRAASTETSNSDNNNAQLGAFAPSLIHSNIGTIHGSLFSNNQSNQIHHHHHHHPQADDDADYAKIKVRDIILETELGSHNFHHDLQSDGTLVEVGRIRKYTGRLFQQPHGSMLIHKYEGLAISNWKRDFHRLSGVRHPNIIQLYGLCCARNFTALIFHNVQKTGFDQYHLSLSGPSFVSYIADAMDQLQSAGNALQGHGLEPYFHYIPVK
ncbi:hypothetical protein C8J56DRAFT_1172036 [Mycena floridula]|nr:hypothetical protein C8J56DRAFT_1172036 [Mycena floridula]